jgi:hypothetical protein
VFVSGDGKDKAFVWRVVEAQKEVLEEKKEDAVAADEEKKADDGDEQMKE